MIGRYPATPRWVYWSSIGATAFAIAGEGYGIVEVLSRRDKVAQNVPAGAGARMFIRPSVIGAGLLAAWWWFFRHEAEGSRDIALLAAMFFGATAGVMGLSMQVSDWHYCAFCAVGYPLCRFAFPVYASKAGALICCGSQGPFAYAYSRLWHGKAFCRLSSATTKYSS